MLKIFNLLFIIWIFFFPLKGHACIVDTEKIYTYDALTEDLMELSKMYPDLITYQTLTTTPFGRNVWAIKVGNGETTILINGAHHAREWLTSALLMKMIETYADAYQNGHTVEDLHPSILDKVSIWFVPMVNPDGVTLQQTGLNAYPIGFHPFLIEMNEGSWNFERWKANLFGMDLNRQYPANWSHLKGVNRKPSYQFYKGTQPLEADEARALVDFTYQIKPEIAVSYHSSGNMIFWGYHQWGLTHTTKFTRDYYAIAEKVSELTKYPIDEPESYQQGGGYTDWFIEEFSKPAFTVEIGQLIEDRSLPLEEFLDIWVKNKKMGLFLAERALKRKNEK
ncbi:M14 family zinc carboxypeptidase [Niallia endozanthoxylica]|uniref:Peptidase M14 n=1 Tax=Niallia endozanthoxylica TaxID=2036016 RepID=A0A5J5GW36_9BACI|nr:M14 family zinc carboxypeptidase [Niallia endozanthoxylica]KAA9011868.1 peptidase M14 [Niallia endozanthoxylica]